MIWKLLYHPRAFKQLKRLHKSDQKRAIDNLKKLVNDSKAESLDVIQLAGTKRSFRMRIGKVRVIFEKDSKSKIIYVWRIKYRKDIYRL